MKNPEMLRFPGTELPNERVARGVRPIEGTKPVFCLKKPKMTQNAQNFLEFVLGLSYLVPCSFKEALAKMWRGSGLFLRFCALANRLWSTFILALHTCIRAQ